MARSLVLEGENMDTVVTVTEMKHHMDELLERAAQGDRVLIQRRGKPPIALIRLNVPAEQGDPVPSAKETGRQRLERAAAQLGDRCRLSPEQQRLEALGAKSERDGLADVEREELLQLLHKLEEKSRERAKTLGEML